MNDKITEAVKCRHCGDSINVWTCETGDKHEVADQCRTCHNELSHGIIRIQNIHICGGGPDPGHSNGLWENLVREYEEGYIPSRRAKT